MIKGLNFVGLDFETANFTRASACSVGLSKFIDGELVDEMYSLIDPEAEFIKQTIAIHRILPHHVEGKPNYATLLPVMLEFIDSLPVVAHNAPFDMSVITKSNARYGISQCDIAYIDSLAISRQLYDLENHKLNTVANALGIDLNHHDAKSDAYAAGEIIVRTAQIHNVDNLDDLLQLAGYLTKGQVINTIKTPFSKSIKCSVDKLSKNAIAARLS